MELFSQKLSQSNCEDYRWLLCSQGLHAFWTRITMECEPKEVKLQNGLRLLSACDLIQSNYDFVKIKASSRTKEWVICCQMMSWELLKTVRQLLKIIYRRGLFFFPGEPSANWCKAKVWWKSYKELLDLSTWFHKEIWFLYR